MDERAIALGVRLMAATALTAMVPGEGPAAADPAPGAAANRRQIADAALA